MDTQGPRSKKGSPCPHCGNLLKLRPDQLGEQVQCPKCGKTFTVGRSEAKEPASLDDLYEPEVPLRKSTIVPDEPVTIVHEEAPTMRVPEADDEVQVDLATSAPLAQDVVYDVDWSGAGELEAESPQERPVLDQPDYLKLAREQGYVRVEEEQYTPRWTFFSTVYEFPWMGQNLWRWGTMTFGFCVSGFFVVVVLHLMKREPDIFVPFVVLAAVGTSLLSVVVSSAFFLSAIQDTADGYREVQASSLADFDQWFVSAIGVLYVAALAALVGYPFSLIDEVGMIAIPIAMAILFPFLVLSAMDGGSFFVPYSPRIVRTLIGVWWAWLFFYLMSTLIVVGWGYGMLEGYQRRPFPMVLVAAPVLATIVLIYARLLGRVAWKAGVVLEAGGEVDASAHDGGKRARRKRRRGQRRRIDFPPELDQAARYVDPPPGSPPR